MARIAVLVHDDVEDAEFRVPVDRLTGAGHDVVVAGPEAGATYTGKRGEEKITADIATGELDADHFDAAVLPGGYAPDHLRLDPASVRFVSQVDEQGKPLAAICHAGSLLIDAGAVHGRRLTSWPSIRVDLVHAGADWVDESVVVDGNLITSRKPDDLDDFCAAIETALATTDRASAATS